MEYVLMCFMVHRFLKEEEQIVIVGDEDVLGSWDISRGVTLTNLPLGSSQWVGVVRVPAKKLFYKAVVVSPDGACWEAVDNRQVSLSSPGQALVKFEFGQPMEHLEITNETDPTINSTSRRGIEIVLPYWRHSMKTQFVFVQETGGSTERHSCVYRPKDGTAVVSLPIPEDSKLVGHFEVQCGSDIKESDRREVLLPKDGATFKILWPFSGMEDHMCSVSEFSNSPNIIEPKDKVLKQVASDISKDQEVAPPIPTFSTVTHLEKEHKKKTRGLGRLLRGARRLFRRIKRR